MGIIKIKDLIFEYIRRDEEGNVEGITKAVDDVNLDIKQGDFVAILGHNGSGKSTLAKHMNAILYPSEGSVWVDGKIHSRKKIYGTSDRPQEWCSRIRTIRLVGRSWKRMLDLDRRTWV